METNDLETKDEPNNKYTCFSLRIDGPVAHMRMIRPKQHNSMTAEFWTELPQVIDEIEANTTIRSAVLSAEGPTFSSGMDRSIFANAEALKNGTPEEKERFRRLVLHYQSVLNRIDTCRVPIIAAVQGGCLGAALDLVCRCKIRYATEDAYFTIYEINLAMMADLGTLQYLPKLIGEAPVWELALTGDRLSAERAFTLGFCSKVLPDDCDVMVHALEVARKIAQHSPKAVMGTSWALTYARNHSITDALQQAAIWQAEMFDSSEVITAMTAQRKGCTPEFADLIVDKIEL